MIVVSIVDVTWHVTQPKVTLTLLESVPNDVPLIVNIVLGVLGVKGVMEVRVGLDDELNVKLQFAIWHTAATPFAYVANWSVLAWSDWVVKVKLVSVILVVLRFKALYWLKWSMTEVSELMKPSPVIVT